MFNPDYDRYSEIMSDSVNQFITLLLERLERNIQREQRHNRLTMAVLAGLLLLMMAASLWQGWRLRDRGRHGGDCLWPAIAAGIERMSQPKTEIKWFHVSLFVFNSASFKAKFRRS
ncbi:hypothetical protein MBH78_09705 [Oceanimonas sp. NS1]|nr:hypothetical protein [Oceanimonas sp. NS1]